MPSSTKRILLKVVRPIFLGLWGASLIFLLPGALLIAIHETVSGLLCGVLVVTVLAIPAAALIGGRRRLGPRVRLAATVALATMALAALVTLFARVAPDVPAPGAPIQSRVPRNPIYRQSSVWNLLPEIDQVKLGITLAPFCDPIIDLAQARRILDLTIPLYREMEALPEIAGIGSVLHHGYADLLGLRPATNHYFRVEPARAPGERLPAIVFLHGSAGNFKVYPWVWRKFAEGRKVVVACPTLGFGNWEQPGGVEAVEGVVRDLVKADVDPERIYLAGLSNGGRGLTRCAAAAPSRYRGLIAISAILDEEVLGAATFAGGWGEKPVLLIHGEKDDRVGAAMARRAAALLTRAGTKVTLRLFPGEDHFLFFSALEDVFGAVDAWMAATEGR